MIHYQLQCRQGHGFDGWFRDSAAFDAQAARGLVECPQCGATTVSRALMAPAVSRSRALVPLAPPPPVPAPQPAAPEAGAPEAGAPEAGPIVVGGERMPDHVRAMLQRLRAEVERNCDYVGGDFADEARRIHNGESGARGIYGETSPEEAEALADEGIQIGRIPWLPRADG
jgi:hypothetical protein